MVDALMRTRVCLSEPETASSYYGAAVWFGLSGQTLSGFARRRNIKIATMPHDVQDVLHHGFETLSVDVEQAQLAGGGAHVRACEEAARGIGHDPQCAVRAVVDGSCQPRSGVH